MLHTASISFLLSAFLIRNSVTCIYRNVIYTIMSYRCRVKYTEQTERQLCIRIRGNLLDIRNQASKPVAARLIVQVILDQTVFPSRISVIALVKALLVQRLLANSS